MGRVAWIHGDYIEILDAPTVEETPEAIPTNSDSTTTFVEMGDVATNIRSIPSTEGDLIYKAQPGEQFEFIDSSEDWYHIRIDENTTGYVAGWRSEERRVGKECRSRRWRSE